MFNYKKVLQNAYVCYTHRYVYLYTSAIDSINAFDCSTNRSIRIRHKTHMHTIYIRKIILITILYRKTPNKIQKKKIDFYLTLDILD